MSDTITLRGYVATDLRQNTTDNGLAVASFRMCTTERRYDRDTGGWQDGQTNWYAVSLFRQLATNAAFSIHKGDRVVVTGRLRLRQWVTEDGRSGTSADIDADTVGHDLMWGTASFRRTTSAGSDASGVGGGVGGGMVGGAGTDDDAAGPGSHEDPESAESLGRIDALTGELLDAVAGDSLATEDEQAETAKAAREGAAAPY